MKDCSKDYRFYGSEDGMRCNSVVQLFLFCISDFEFYAFGGFTVHFYFKLSGIQRLQIHNVFSEIFTIIIPEFGKEISGKIGGEVNFL